MRQKVRITTAAHPIILNPGVIPIKLVEIAASIAANFIAFIRPKLSPIQPKIMEPIGLVTTAKLNIAKNPNNCLSSEKFGRKFLDKMEADKPNKA